MPPNSIRTQDRNGYQLMAKALEATPEGKLGEGASQKAVLYLERALLALGFKPGTKNTTFDAKTAAAVKAFQAAWGLEATGELDAATFKKLQGSLERVRKHGSAADLAAKKGFQGAVGVGQRSKDVFVVERRLKNLGYDVGTADSTFDLKTREAVMAFKRDQKELRKGAKNGIFGAGASKVLSRETQALDHAAQRVRVRTEHKSRKALDARTAKAVAKNPIDEGTRGPSVANIQKHLRNAGFDPKRTDGTFDERTAGAVRAFQRKSKLPETGVVNARTWRALAKTYLYATGDASPAQRLNEKSSAVLRSERILKKLGHNPGKVDGVFDGATARAAKAFERKHRLDVDGAIGSGQLKKMKSVLAKKEALEGQRTVAGYYAGTRRTIKILPVGGGHSMRTDAALSFRKLMAAGRKAGFNFVCNSGFRSMSEQQALYRKWLNGTGNPAARPGYSNHQGGLAMDIGNVGPFGSSAYNWLARNAGKYGFSNAEGRRVNEPWHWVYVR